MLWSSSRLPCCPIEVLAAEGQLLRVLSSQQRLMPVMQFDVHTAAVSASYSSSGCKQLLIVVDQCKLTTHSPGAVLLQHMCEGLLAASG